MDGVGVEAADPMIARWWEWNGWRGGNRASIHGQGRPRHYGPARRRPEVSLIWCWVLSFRGSGTQAGSLCHFPGSRGVIALTLVPLICREDATSLGFARDRFLSF